jgi:hypothetical protein
MARFLERLPSVSKRPLVFNPARSEHYIRMFVSMCWPESDEPSDRLLSIAATVAGEFQTFAQDLLDLADGTEIPPSGTLFRLLAPFQENPILGKPVFELVNHLIFRFASGTPDHAGRVHSDGADYIGTERDFWRLIHREEVLTRIYGIHQQTCYENSLLMKLSGRAFDDIDSAKIASAPPFAAVANEGMSLLLGAPMLTALSLVVFATIRECHRPDLEPSLTLARQIIKSKVTIDQRSVGIDRQYNAWRAWKHLSAFWAGVLLEAAPWHPVKLIDEYSIQRRILEVIADDERRLRACRFAEWFCDVATSHAYRSPRTNLVGGVRIARPYIIARQLEPVVERVLEALPFSFLGVRRLQSRSTPVKSPNTHRR